jgi:hypothetical protein
MGESAREATRSRVGHRLRAAGPAVRAPRQPPVRLHRHARLSRRRLIARRLRIGRGRRGPAQPDLAGPAGSRTRRPGRSALDHPPAPQPPLRGDPGRAVRPGARRQFLAHRRADLPLPAPQRLQRCRARRGHRHRAVRRRRRPDRHHVARPRRGGERAGVHRRRGRQLHVAEHPARLLPAAPAHVGAQRADAAAQPVVPGALRRSRPRGRDDPRHHQAADRCAVHREIQSHRGVRPGPDERRRAVGDASSRPRTTSRTRPTRLRRCSR